METYPGRERLAKDLNLDPQAASSSGPLLAYLVQHALSPISVSRQLKFTEGIPSSHTVTSGTPQAPTIAISDASRAAVASNSTGASSLYPQAAPTLHSAQLSTSTAGLGQTQLESDSERFSQNFAEVQHNDKHFRLGLNSNKNGNTEGGQKATLLVSHQSKSDPSGTADVGGVEGVGVGLINLQLRGVYAELGETFVSSADSSLDVDKLINASSDSERLHGLLKPSSGGDEASREELDDFFDSPLPSALQGSKEDQIRSVTLMSAYFDTVS